MKNFKSASSLVCAAAIALLVLAPSTAHADLGGSFVSAGSTPCQWAYTGSTIVSDGLGTIWIQYPGGGESMWWWVDEDGDGLGHYESANGSTLHFDSDPNDPNNPQGSTVVTKTYPGGGQSVGSA